jgi:mycofactocin precursor
MTSTATELPVTPDVTRTETDTVTDDEHVLADLLVEEISIDGMCGVY